MDLLKPKVTVIIDVFRAFTTAAYILNKGPESYFLMCDGKVLSQHLPILHNPLLIGKPEKGSTLIYEIPNSPTRVLDVVVRGRSVLHRTEAGARGVLSARNADIVLAASFVNAQATCAYIQSLGNAEVTLQPMGHEATSPSLEDDLCAHYLATLLNNKSFDIRPYLAKLKLGAGRYFFLDDQWQYPEADFKRCLSQEIFSFAIRAQVYDDYALLTRVPIASPKGSVGAS